MSEKYKLVECEYRFRNDNKPYNRRVVEGYDELDLIQGPVEDLTIVAIEDKWPGNMDAYMAHAKDVYENLKAAGIKGQLMIIPNSLKFMKLEKVKDE